MLHKIKDNRALRIMEILEIQQIKIDAQLEDSGV